VTEAGAAASSGPAPAPAAAKQWDDRKVIIDRNLFNASTLAPAAVAQTMDENERYAKSTLPLRLLGTVAAGPASWAALERLDGDRKGIVVRVNEDLSRKWGLSATVLRIERGRVVFVNAGRREELTLETPSGTFGDDGPGRSYSARAPSATQASPRARRSPAEPAQQGVNGAVQRLAENRFALPRGDVEAAAANPAALFSQARILPKYDEGRMVGVQLNAIRPGSLFAQVGIQDGDTVSQVNGVTVASPEDSQRLLEQFAAGGALRVTVTGRDGQVRELEYVAQ
jgi:general secretion pathway protein C